MQDETLQVVHSYKDFIIKGAVEETAPFFASKKPKDFSEFICRYNKLFYARISGEQILENLLNYICGPNLGTVSFLCQPPPKKRSGGERQKHALKHAAQAAFRLNQVIIPSYYNFYDSRQRIRPCLISVGREYVSCLFMLQMLDDALSDEDLVDITVETPEKLEAYEMLNEYLKSALVMMEDIPIEGLRSALKPFKELYDKGNDLKHAVRELKNTHESDLEAVFYRVYPSLPERKKIQERSP